MKDKEEREAESEAETGEADEDPWKIVSAADGAAAVGRALVEDDVGELSAG